MSDKVLFLISRSYYFILQTFKKIKKHFFSSVNPLYTLSKCDRWGHQSKDSEWFYLAGILDWSAFIPTSFSIWARYTTEGSDWYKQDLCHIKPKEEEVASADSEQPDSFSTVSLNLERKKEKKKKQEWAQFHYCSCSVLIELLLQLCFGNVSLINIWQVHYL